MATPVTYPTNQPIYTYQVGIPYGVHGLDGSGKPITLPIVVLPYASTISLDPTLGEIFMTTTIDATGVSTINAASKGFLPQKMTVMIYNDATSSKTITFGTNFRTSGTLAAGAASKIAVITFIGDGTNWVEINRIVGIV